MTISNGDFVMIRTTQIYQLQAMLNVYTYQFEGTTEDIDDSDLAEIWADEVGPLVNALQITAVSNSEVYVRPLTGGNTEGSYAWPGGGVASAQGFPPYVSIGFKLIRGNTSVRHGYKRYSGLNEAGYDNAGNPTVAGLITALDDLATVLADGVTFTYNGTESGALVPVIVGRLPNGGFDLSRWATVESAVWTRTGSQNTRKIGRGM